jgi:hypothetical protein
MATKVAFVGKTMGVIFVGVSSEFRYELVTLGLFLPPERV